MSDFGRKLSPLEAIEVATTPIEQPEEQKVDPADQRTMQKMYQAFGPNQMQSAKRGDSILRRLHSELASVDRQDGSTKVATASQRTKERDSRLGAPSGTFQMVRDWDPTDDKKGT